jgi:hypothetical protein
MHPGSSIMIDAVNTRVLLAIPEPGAFAFLAAGMTALLALRRSRPCPRVM